MVGVESGAYQKASVQVFIFCKPSLYVWTFPLYICALALRIRLSILLSSGNKTHYYAVKCLGKAVAEKTTSQQSSAGRQNNQPQPETMKRTSWNLKRKYENFYLNATCCLSTPKACAMHDECLLLVRNMYE
eukprot:6172037-Pleurochrysis_carterae.AAC.3